MKFFIKLCLILMTLLSISHQSSAEEEKKCDEFKKLSKEYLVCTAKKVGKTINKNLKIDGKSPSEVKEEIVKMKN